MDSAAIPDTRQPAAPAREAVARGVLFLNPNSRSGDGNCQAFVDALGAAGIATDICPAASPEAMCDGVRRLRGDGRTDFVIIGGGDGTLSAVAPALLDLGKPFGILPLGTANDLARTLAIPTGAEEAAAVVAAGRTRRIDVGLINGRPFFNVASLGLAAEIARAHEGDGTRSSRLKRLLGVLNYPLNWWHAYKNSRPFRVEIVHDGGTVRPRCVQIAIGNGRFYGGGMTVHECASIEDGRLHVYWVGPRRILGWLRLLPALRQGRLKDEKTVGTLSTSRAAVRSGRRMRFDVDGELAETTPAAFEVRHAALTVFAPDRPEGGQDAST